MGTIITLVILAGLVWYAISIYNNLVSSRNRVGNAFSQIDVQLTRRYDLIPNLVEAVKGYMGHERGTLEAVINARNAASAGLKKAAADPSDPDAIKALAAAEATLGGTLGRLFALAEAYPDLKANQNMQQLQEELTSTENKVAFARQAFNDAVLSYNNACQNFPGNLIANNFGFKTAEYLEIEQRREARGTEGVVQLTAAALDIVDFFARQEQSRRTSRALVGVFLLAFILVALATTVVVAAGLRLYTENNSLFLGTENWRQWLDGHGGLVVTVAVGTFGAMVLASLYRAATLARGGGHVARSLGGTRVSGDRQRPARAAPRERRRGDGARLRACRCPRSTSSSRNRASTRSRPGARARDAAIAVTRGALEHLDRNELQGVIAHEFSHILNGDMRLNQQLIGLVVRHPRPVARRPLAVAQRPLRAAEPRPQQRRRRRGARDRRWPSRSSAASACCSRGSSRPACRGSASGSPTRRPCSSRASRKGSPAL